MLRPNEVVPGPRVHAPGRVLAATVVRFAARPERLAELHAAFDDFFAAAKVAHTPVRAADRAPLVTAGVEIATNIIVHACREVPDSEVGVSLTRFAHSVEIAFEDVGVPYVVVEATGRGLRLARASVHLLQYRRDGSINRWHLVRDTGLPAPEDGEW